MPKKTETTEEPKLSKAAQRIHDIGHLRDAQTVKEKIKEVYGFTVTDIYAAEFAKFVLEMVKLADGKLE